LCSHFAIFVPKEICIKMELQIPTMAQQTHLHQ